MKTSTGPVVLTAQQRQVFDQLTKKFSEIMTRIHSRNVQPDEVKDLGVMAAQLHKSLKDSGIQVRHHKYMIENRGMMPDDPLFYDHVHPVEDLIRFINEQSANDDPEDQTIGHAFEFVVFSRRWGHTDTYTVTRTKTGWTFMHMQGPIITGKDGRIRGQDNTGLFDMLDHDSINYPEELPGYFKWLWDHAAENGLTPEQVQDAIQTLAGWVNCVEKSSPAGIFQGFK